MVKKEEAEGNTQRERKEAARGAGACPGKRPRRRKRPAGTKDPLSTNWIIEVTALLVMAKLTVTNSNFLFSST